MKLRATRTIFVDGALRNKGDVFLSRRRWKYTDLIDASAAPGEAAEEGTGKNPNRKAIMAELSAVGVSFHATAKTEDLADLLADAKKSAAPAASNAEPKQLGGVGDQDVI